MAPCEADSSLRWKVLVCTCVGLFGQFYCYDNPSALADQIKSHFSHRLTDDEFAYYFNLLYTVYSLPNVILPLAFGYVMDRAGIRISIVCLGGVVFLGSLLVALGVYVGSISMMLFGRFIFGLGGESLQVAQSALLYQMFRGEEVAFALGANLSIARAGSVLNDILSPFLCDHFGISSAFIFGAGMVFISFAANILSVYMDKNIALAQDTKDDASLMPSLTFTRQFWVLVCYSCCIYSAILPFNNIAAEFFVQARGATHQAAGNALAMLFLFSAIFTPVFGYFVDYVGNRTHFLLAAAFVLVISHSLLFHLPPPVVCMLIGGVYMVFAGVVWPTFGLTVSEKQLGSAYGVATSFQNIGLSIAPILVAALQGSTSDVTKGYEYAASLFVGLGFVGIIMGNMLHHHPSAAQLNLPSFSEKSELVGISERSSPTKSTNITEYTAILGKESDIL